ncbi:MAG: phospholipid carrier-dependent glycosyltransferase [Chloroflexi bacterium]|nr:phospholipid carrier-dependent glycosyltransferase [Chloroflexota bacterium]
MKALHLKILIMLTILEGVLALLLSLADPSDPENAWLFGLSKTRMALLAFGFCGLILLVSLTIRIFRDSHWSGRISERISSLLTNRTFSFGTNLFVVQSGLLVLLLALVECFLLTWLSIPTPARPFIAWGMLVCMQTWILFRLVFSKKYQEQRTFMYSFQNRWKECSPAQRKTVSILLVIALVYFSLFIPFNLQGANNPDTFLIYGGDEYVIYPIVVNMLTPGETVSSTLYRVIVYEEYHYGYPFFLSSALVLLIPRIINGADFAQQTEVSLLLLRQFVSVLPMILSILILVYIVTGFKSVARSVSLFVFLLFIPGVVKYNVRFWHPDSLMLLFVMLTILFLQRDRLRFGKHFFFAAIACGLATATKLYGIFFFLAIGGYLVAGLIQKIHIKHIATAALGFLVLMTVTILISTPFLAVPSARNNLARIMEDKSYELKFGYDEPDPEGVYQTGFVNWMRYFEKYYTQPYFFYFLAFTLAIGSLIGSEKYLSSRVIITSLLFALFTSNFQLRNGSCFYTNP